jgi:hypothetical protein
LHLLRRSPSFFKLLLTVDVPIKRALGELGTTTLKISGADTVPDR